MEQKNKLDQACMMQFIENLDAAAVLDETGTYIYVSPSWQRFTGHTAQDALGRKVWELLPDTHAPEVLRTGKPVLAQVVRAQGVPAVTNYIPRLDANGKVIGVFIYVIVYGKQNVDDVSARLSELSREVEFYKKELSRIRGARYSMDNIIG